MVTKFDHNLVMSENVELVNCQLSLVIGHWSLGNFILSSSFFLLTPELLTPDSFLYGNCC
ncbi:MAG: hypothetical protein PT120_08325 [Aphanizomenon gracile PMC649.10]|nr:hypothetical protein [Aphanizomenon gracile PMC638.10]MDM3852642.1 hypothetical protein [Aphanizomenon gracile PMC627.10]MDM3854896.1 hypothetical protein [Aphanizomenon gracile PMC649.10]